MKFSIKALVSVLILLFSVKAQAVSVNDTTSRLSEVVVESSAKLPKPEVEIPVSVESLGKSFFIQKNSTNFVKTLTKLPGIESMDIGAGFSKPVIRGMGFNRIAVVDKGIVQQNQQWGADHGLEIDQYDVDNVRVHKGPMSLRYGSDAIGGVIEILPTEPPEKNYFWGDITFIGKSNNDLLGTSFAVNWKHNKWFLRGRFTEQHFGDYRIPADTITYLTWQMPIYKRRMKNTSGMERSASLSANYRSEKFETWLHVSDVYAKNGFFPGAHGIPDLSRLKHDGSYRNIEMPYSTANHLKIISNNTFFIGKHKLLADIGFQQNSREEISAFHTHYSNQKPPAEEPNKELAFLLNTLSGNFRFALKENHFWTNIFGLSFEYQHNSVGGYSFLLPNFNQISGGAYWVSNYKVCSHLALSAGLRYDLAKINIKGFYDKILEEYLQGQGYNQQDVVQYATRVEELHKNFADWSASVGLAYSTFRHKARLNIGKSFRYPSANELASNGVHHGAFRHELGNRNLKPESSYQLDLGYEFQTKKIKLSLTPYASYFTNYIFLEPSGRWSILPHTGQFYSYRQAKVFMAGSEISLRYDIIEDLSANISGDYNYNLNLSDGYPLPFSVPAKLHFDVDYSSTTHLFIKSYSFNAGFDYVFAQNHIARNEEPTPSAFLINLSASAFFRIKKFAFTADLQVQNLLNTAYFNHLSFYRKLNAPEAGRNIQLIIKIPFGV